MLEKEVSLKLEVHYVEHLPYGNGTLEVYRDDTIFLPTQEDFDFFKDEAPLIRYLSKKLRGKGNRIAVIKSQRDSYDFRFTPIFVLNGEVNQTVTQNHWDNHRDRYYEKGYVITIRDGLNDIINEWCQIHCQ